LLLLGLLFLHITTLWCTHMRSMHTAAGCSVVLPQVGVSEIVGRIVEDLKDEAEPYRRMVMETIDKVVSALGAADIDARLEELLVDGILYAFQEQVGYEMGSGLVG
jgi:splicing factor 3B subunit 1